MSGRKSDDVSEADSSDDLTTDIVGVQGYVFSVPAKKSFRPRHKPRKQFVRNDQWCYYIRELIDENQTKTETLTYFGLPGVDLLDIRYFGSAVCEPRSLKLRFLGFDKDADPQSEGQAEFNISFDEVSKMACTRFG